MARRAGPSCLRRRETRGGRRAFEGRQLRSVDAGHDRRGGRREHPRIGGSRQLDSRAQRRRGGPRWPCQQRRHRRGRSARVCPARRAASSTRGQRHRADCRDPGVPAIPAARTRPHRLHRIDRRTFLRLRFLLHTAPRNLRSRPSSTVCGSSFSPGGSTWPSSSPGASPRRSGPSRATGESRRIPRAPLS